MAEEPTEDIDWDRGDDVVVPPQRAIRVYTNKFGEVVIAQEPSDPGDEDFPFIVIRRENVRTVIAALTREADLGPTAL